MNEETLLIIEGRRAAETGRGVRVREAVGLSQSELARVVGVQPATVSRWESGDRRPRGSSAIAYAKALRELAEGIVAT